MNKLCSPGQYYCNTDQMCKPIPKGYTVDSNGMLIKESNLIQFNVWLDEQAGLAAKAKKSGISLSTLRKVYRRGVAAWNSGHRPGTTPQQWGMARVNSYITKGKTYHTADKDLREETKISGTNCKNCIHWIKESEKPVDKSELNENGGLKPPNEAYVAMAKHADLITLPGKATVKIKAYCDHEDIHDFVTERMCCAYWDNKEAKRPFKGKADVMESEGVYMPSKYKTGVSTTDKARAAHWKKMSKLSDRDPKAYQDAPGDKKARKEGIPTSKYTKKYRKMFGEQANSINERFEEHFGLINNSIENQE